MDQPLLIRLTRYAQGYRCKMYFDGLERGDTGAARVQAGRTQTFTTSREPVCRVGSNLPPLEFEATLTSSPVMIWQTATLQEETEPRPPAARPRHLCNNPQLQSEGCQSG